MEIGIGLPSTLPNATGADILTWAREADTAGFSTLGTIDRSSTATTRPSRPSPPRPR